MFQKNKKEKDIEGGFGGGNGGGGGGAFWAPKIQKRINFRKNTHIS